MNKYFSIYNTSFKHEKTAIVDTLLRCAIYFVIMYIMIQLWSYIYGGGVNKIINGYSLNQMIWYLLIGEMIINCVRTRSITQGISNEVRSGSICYKLNKPYNYYMYCVTTSMAKSCFTF